MDVSIIIPSFNTKTLLEDCLHSIVASMQSTNITYEVIVIDNHSTDGTHEVLTKNYPHIKTIYNSTNVGYGKANNIGIEHAKGEYILLLNSDITVLDNSIALLYEFGKLHPNAFIGGKLYEISHDPQPSCGPFYSILNVFIMLFMKGDYLGLTRMSPNKERRVDWVSGACLLGTKKAFIDVGLFDEQIFMYMEEIDLLYRAMKKGYDCYFFPNATFIHVGAASSKSKRTPVVNIYKGLLYFYRKHKSIIEQWVLRGMLRVKAYLAIALGRLLHKTSLRTIYEEALEYT